MDPTVLAFTVVVLAAFAFGVVTVPLGPALGLDPVLTAVGVFLGSAAFVLAGLPLVADRVPDQLARRVRQGIRHAPRAVRWWRRAAGDRAGVRAAALLTGGSTILDRLGYRGVAVLAPVTSRWLVPAVGIALDAPRPSLSRWAVLGCATWAVIGTVVVELLVQLLRQP